MQLALVSVVLLGASLTILGVANASLVAWAYGAERRLPIDRDDSSEARLSKIGVDATFGTLPLLVCTLLQAYSIDGAIQVSENQSIGVILATVAYVVIYFAFIRRHLGAFRLAVRQRITASRDKG